jgi:hypothetical protein
MRIFITTADIVRLSGCSISTAQRELRIVRDALGKLKHNKVTFAEYCTYHVLDLQELKKSLDIR